MLRRKLFYGAVVDESQPTRSVRPVDALAMIDAYDDDLMAFVVDAVEHSVRPATCGVDAAEISTQGLPDAAGVLDKRAADVSRRADNPMLMGALPDLHVDVTEVVDDLDSERAAR